ncbi:MAG: signal peptidase II [Acidimicrobiales bacterium]|nr:signal peptidase II [Acidimicrobiales bacterium]
MTLRRHGVFTTATAALVAIDLATKAWAVRALENGPIELPGPVDLQLSYNDGIAFGFFDQLPATVLIGASMLIAALLVRAWQTGQAPAVPASMLVAGATSNSIDRLESGSVIDMLHLGWWPTFNIADIYIVTGIALWVVLTTWPAPTTVTARG